MSDEGMSDADVFNALEDLGDALFVLSGRLKSVRFLDDDVNHAAYERVVAAWTNCRAPPTPAAEEREAVAQWCSGCQEVRSVDCYRAGCPKSDTERRAAEILAAEREREAFAERVFRHGFSDGWTANQKGRLAASASVDEAWHFYVADGALQKSVALTANHSAPVVEE